MFCSDIKHLELCTQITPLTHSGHAIEKNKLNFLEGKHECAGCAVHPVQPPAGATWYKPRPP